MKVLYLGSFCTESFESILLSKSKYGIQYSIINFQRNFFLGLNENIKEKADYINLLPIGCYPFYYKDVFIKNKKYSYNNSEIKELGFVNIPIIKQYILKHKAKQEIKKWIKKNRDENKLIVMYDLLYPYLYALHNIKGKYPDTTTCTIIADLPNQYGYNYTETRIKAYLKYRQGKKKLEYLHSINYFALLTEQMRDVLNIDKNRSVIIEGFSTHSRKSVSCVNRLNSGKKVILYCGALFKVYGIDILIEAFNLICDNRYELWFCGSGDYVQQIVKECDNNSRIRYWGYLGKDRVCQLQSEAAVLINPRQNIGEYTKYSFPSKIMEYLSSNCPVVAYKLDGIPDEYYQFIFTPLDNTSLELKNTLLKVCEMDYNDRLNICNLAREFIENNKNPIIQCKKIVDLLKENNVV